MSSNTTNVAFLFGAGISIKAGMPSTSAITERVLSGESIYSHTNDTFQDWPALNPRHVPEVCVPRITSFLRLLHRWIEHRYSKRKDFRETYEDLYNLVAQLNGDSTGEYDNPAIGPLVSALGREVADLPQQCGGAYPPKWGLPDFVYYAENYIRDVAWCMLRRKQVDHYYLDGLVSLLAEPRLGLVNVFTLNHDLVLEHVLFDGNVAFNYGFTAPGRDRIRKWIPELFDELQPRVRVFKLHGSLNWFVSQIGDDSARYVIPLGNEAFLEANLAEDRPVMLLGTTNKLLEYTLGIFDDLHCLYCRELRKCDRLIVSGYSFGDKAINTQVVAWLHRSSAGKMLIIHPHEDELVSQARPAIQRMLTSGTYRDRIEIMPRRIEDLDWDEVKAWAFD